jgi:hypothetical protein
MCGSEIKAHLQFESPVIRAFREDAGTSSGGLVGLPKKRRRDVADDWSWIVMIGQIADLYRSVRL